jgi:hypothetical protein
MPSFIKIGSGFQKLIPGDGQTQRWSHKPTYIFFQIRKVCKLKITSASAW